MSAPLEGIKVLDLSWVMVGPFSTRYLADLGADVVKVESSTRIDPLRTLGPFKDGVVGPERSVSYHNLNAGKRSIALNLKRAEAQDIVKRLTRWADIVVESFTPRVLRGLALTYEDLKLVKPNLIMVSTSIGGQTGPYADEITGVGTMGASLSGATFLMGWPDRPPVGPFGPWTDEVAPRFIVSTVLAALHRRRQTGEGCYIDLSQAEAGMQFILPAAWEYGVNGAIPQRRGAQALLRCPCGPYPTVGVDCWVAIDGSAPTHWEALRKTIGGPILDDRYDTLIGRLRHRESVDDVITSWTTQFTAEDAEVQLQKAGVPAHSVVRAMQIAADPDIRLAGHLTTIQDPVIGQAEIEGPRFRFERTPTPVTRRGPLIGEHSHEVLTTCAAFSDSEISALAEAGVLV